MEKEVAWVNYLQSACSSFKVALCDNSEWTIIGKLIQFSEYLPEIWQLLDITMRLEFAQTTQNESIKNTMRQPAPIQY